MARRPRFRADINRLLTKFMAGNNCGAPPLTLFILMLRRGNERFTIWGAENAVKLRKPLGEFAMLRARPFILLFLLLFMTPVLAGDRHPPQLSVSFLAEPAPIVQDGSTRLVYEMAVSNFSKSRYVLETIEARAGQTRASFSGPTLTSMIVRFGSDGKPDMADGGAIRRRRWRNHFLDARSRQGSGPRRDRAFSSRA